MRLSSYTILSDPLPGGGYVLMNGYNGAIDLISDKVALALVLYGKFRGPEGKYYTPKLREKQKHYLNYDRPKIDENSIEKFLPFEADLIDFFSKRGHLTKLSHVEEKELVKTMSEVLHEKAKKQPSFVLVPSLDCNYRCLYCYERVLQNSLDSDLSNVNYLKKNVVLSSDQVDAIYKCINELKKYHEDESNDKSITLYGGEPFNAANKELIYEIVSKGKLNGFTFSVTTNGHDLEHFLPLINKGGISHIQITLDGPQKIHDRKRISADGTSSFNKIISNIHSLLNLTDLEINIRVNLDKQNIEYFDELINQLDKEGFLDYNNLFVYISPITVKLCDSKIHTLITSKEITQFFGDRYKSRRNICINSKFIDEIKSLNPSLLQQKPHEIKSVACAANVCEYIFTPDGFIYPCWETLGLDEHKIGSYNLNGNVKINKEVAERWFNRHSAKIPQCLECSFCLLCSGGCAIHALYNNGTLYSNNCRGFNEELGTHIANFVEEFAMVIQKHE